MSEQEQRAELIPETNTGKKKKKEKVKKSVGAEILSWILTILCAVIAALAFVLAAAAEGVSCYAGRGMIYTVLFVGVFGAAVLTLNLKKA